MTPGHSSRGLARSTGVALTGGAIAAYALLDAYVLGPVVIELSAWLDPFVVFGVAAAVLTLINMACCSWLERRGRGPDKPNRVEARLERIGSSRLMRRTVRWIADGSAAGIVLGAVIVNAIFVVGVARFVGGRRVARRRILLASAAYSISFAAFFVAVGFGTGGALQAL